MLSICLSIFVVFMIQMVIFVCAIIEVLLAIFLTPLTFILYLFFESVRIAIIWILGSIFDHVFFLIVSNPTYSVLLVGFCLLLLLGKPEVFLQQSWHQASSSIKSLLSFSSKGFHEILFLLLTWFWHLLFRVTRFSPRRGANHEKQEIPNMIRIKLMIDKECNRVLYAVSDKDFVDVLFRFLTLPMGTIIRLAEKKSGIGCMDNLYKSVENLEDKFLQTKASKTMLLKPKNAYAVLSKNLVVKIDGTDPSKHYICSKFICSIQVMSESFRLASAVKDSTCICGEAMNKEVFLNYLQEVNTDGNSVFVSETQTFMITDDLCISPTSICGCHEILRNLKVDNSKNIEERMVIVGEEEVLQLLKNSFLSKNPMTNTFLLEEHNHVNVDVDNVTLFKTQIRAITSHRVSTTIKPGKRFAKMKVKLLIDKVSNRVLCLEAEDDFLDIVLSFLTLPLGFVLEILRGHCSMGSMDGLYASIIKLDDKKYLKLGKCRDMLLKPKLAPNYSCENQVLKIGEESPTSFTGYRCRNFLCFCSWHEELIIMNPKLPGQVKGGGGFVKKRSTLLIYDDLEIRPLSPTSGILDLLRSNVRMSDIQIQEVEVGGEEVIALLMASMTSKRVLNSVFRPIN